MTADRNADVPMRMTLEVTLLFLVMAWVVILQLAGELADGCSDARCAPPMPAAPETHPATAEPTGKSTTP